jgi:flagellar hook-basal body complex protein FliE
MKDITMLSHLNSMAPHSLNRSQQTTSSGFTDMLANAISETNKSQVAADRAIEKLSSGEEKNIHAAMITMEKADISLRLMVQMRNKILEAYQEIMRMQV